MCVSVSFFFQGCTFLSEREKEKKRRGRVFSCFSLQTKNDRKNKPPFPILFPHSNDKMIPIAFHVGLCVKVFFLCRKSLLKMMHPNTFCFVERTNPLTAECMGRWKEGCIFLSCCQFFKFFISSNFVLFCFVVCVLHLYKWITKPRFFQKNKRCDELVVSEGFLVLIVEELETNSKSRRSKKQQTKKTKRRRRNKKIAPSQT